MMQAALRLSSLETATKAAQSTAVHRRPGRHGVSGEQQPFWASLCSSVRWDNNGDLQSEPDWESD